MNYRRMFLDGHSYYLTLVTHGRKALLIEYIDILRDAFRRSKEKYDYRIDAIVILPDHIHMIITPRTAIDYPKIIRHIKRSFVYGLDRKLKDDAKNKLNNKKYARGHSGIWQERYYEHTVRDEKDFLEILEYMKYNPLKHGLTENIDTWEHSSFYKSM